MQDYVEGTTSQNSGNEATLLIQNVSEPEKEQEPHRVGIVSMTWNFICPHCGLASTGTQPETPTTIIAQATPADEWWETERTAKYLNLAEKTVREGAARGTLPGCKYPPRSSRGKWRFKKEDLDKFLKRRQPPARHQAIERSVWE